MDDTRSSTNPNHNPNMNEDQKKKWFMLGHLRSQLTKAGEPSETIDAISHGTYNPDLPVVERYENSNSC